MIATRTTTLLLILLAALPAQAQRKGKDKDKDDAVKTNAIHDNPDAVKNARKALCEAQLQMAALCLKSKLLEAGRGHLAEAKQQDPRHPGIAELEPKLEGEDAASDSARKSYETKLKSFAKTWEGLQKALLQAEIKAASSGPVLRKASTHMIEYLVSLPSGWVASKKYPVLVTVEGAGCGWMGNHRGFAGAAGDMIVVTPITFWNTNALDAGKYNYPKEIVDKYNAGARREFDEPGLLAILRDVRDQLGGEDKVFITGFSGGGNLTWRMVFGHPDKLRGAIPACANFSDPGPINTTAEERATLPIRAVQGDKDPYLDGKNDKNVNLNAQWEHAKKLCDDNGFGKAERVMLPGVGHATCTKQVVEFIKDVLKDGK